VSLVYGTRRWTSASGTAWPDSGPRRISRSLTAALGREPTLVELARELDAPQEAIEAFSAVPVFAVSFDAPVETGWSGKAVDFLEDPPCKSPYERLLEADRTRLLANSLSQLSERERLVLIGRYGLSDGAEKTLKMLGAELGVCAERARQIEEEALGRLRRNKWTDALRAYAPGE